MESTIYVLPVDEENVLLVGSIVQEVVVILTSLKQNFDNVVSTVLCMLRLLYLGQDLLAAYSRNIDVRVMS
jgi:hypothetical protein